MGGLFRTGRGVIVGETTCASRNLHTLDPAHPAVVRVVSHADAGQVFYGRSKRGEVVHLDSFHQVGLVQHQAIAAALCEACSAYGRDRKCPPGPEWAPSSLCAADLLDVQTATGGGRVTGQLSYGTGKSLRRAHLNHVHVACWLPDDGLDLVFWLVAAVEDEIRRQGLEIRRLEAVEHEFLPGSGKLDMSPYATPSDSLLKGSRCPDGARRDSPTGLGGDGVSARLTDGGIHPDLARLALELAGEFGTLEDVRRVLEPLARTPRGPGWPPRSWHVPGQTISVLRPRGLVRDQGGTLVLTERGWELYMAIEAGRRELEAQFKRILLRQGRKRQSPQGRGRPTGSGLGHGMRTRKEAQLPPKGEPLSAIAVVPTVVASLARQAAEQPPGEDPGAPRKRLSLRVQASDVRVPTAHRRQSVDVCLVLDGSASMAGRRLRAAKYLAQHLLLTSKDKVAVVVFQEREARVVVPFTRDFRSVERGLASIEPLGLTPLADGLIAAAEYAINARRPGACLLLLTDGIPTVPKWGPYPMDDAKIAATDVGRRRLRLVCVGLEPNRGFLTELAAAARGTLYVVDELEPESLLEMVRSQPVLASRQR
jgi:magnesium chelatase subunit D